MRATSRLAVVLALPLVLTACAERERTKPSDHATPRAVPSIPATVFPAPTTLAPTTEAPSAPASSGAVTTAPSGGGETGDAVTAAGVKFTPASLKVKVGTKVTWTTTEYHTVDSGEPGKPDGGPLKAPGGFKTYSYTFDKAGTYKYFCTPHASVGMAGEIVVS